MPRLDYKSLILIVILLVIPTVVGLIVALLLPEPRSGPFILTPRGGDKVGKTFTVAGTSGSGSSVTVRVAVSKTYSTSRDVTANPDYSESFTSPSSGPEAATVTFARTSVDFEIVDDPDLIVDPSEITPMPLEALRKAKVKVKIRHKSGGTPTFAVSLYRENNTLAKGPTNAVHKGGVNWEADFTDVDDGYYSIEVIRTLDGKKTNASRMEKVK